MGVCVYSVCVCMYRASRSVERVATIAKQTINKYNMSNMTTAQDKAVINDLIEASNKKLTL